MGNGYIDDNCLPSLISIPSTMKCYNSVNLFISIRFWRSVPHTRLYVKSVRETDPPVTVTAASEDQRLAPKSSLALSVAVWKGTRIKAGRAVVNLPFTSLRQSSSEGCS